VIRAVTEIVWRVFDYRPSASAEPNSTAPT
jgi:hypothetical protein